MQTLSECVGGAEVEQCTPLAPIQELVSCDMIDNDCDGEIDE